MTVWEHELKSEQWIDRIRRRVAEAAESTPPSPHGHGVSQ